MIKVKIQSEYGYNRIIKDDYYIDEERQIETVNELGEPITETVFVPKLVKGDYIEVDEADLKLIGKTKKFLNGTVVNMTPQETTQKEGQRTAYKQKAQKQKQIETFKKRLAAMDYKTSKYADGEYTQFEWQAIVNERKTIRQQITALESQN